MKKLLKTKKRTIIKRMVAKMLLICTFMCIGTETTLAANEYYYKGSSYSYNNPLYRGYDNTGVGWIYKDQYYLTTLYTRCLTYYHSAWIANQGQTLSLSSTKTRTRSVSEGVSSEIGVTDVVDAKIGGSYTTSVSTEYSSTLGLSYDLSKFSHDSYKIASMGRYCKFRVDRYNNLTGSYVKSYYAYAYDSNYGQEIRLVYR